MGNFHTTDNNTYGKILMHGARSSPSQWIMVWLDRCVIPASHSPLHREYQRGHFATATVTVVKFC